MNVSARPDQEIVKIRVLILPKFEMGEMTGDFPGEAQYYYEAYCAGGEEYEIPGAYEGAKLYVKNGVALHLTGMGKVNAAMSLLMLLTDPRFDFSDAYILGTGCAGSACGSTVMGDVFVITAAVDYDLGHHGDIREMAQDSDTTWFHDAAFDSTACKKLNPDLMNRVYALVKDIRLQTTERTRAFMAATFDHAPWAVREPRVLRGTTITGDNYWKGQYGHKNALLMVKTYGCPDPYALSEMEDVALAVVLDRLNMLDKLIIIRGSVNMDVFMNGMTPEELWAPQNALELASESSVESADIFATAMENNFRVGSVVINAILSGTL